MLFAVTHICTLHRLAVAAGIIALARDVYTLVVHEPTALVREVQEAKHYVQRHPSGGDGGAADRVAAVDFQDLNDQPADSALTGADCLAKWQEIYDLEKLLHQAEDSGWDLYGDLDAPPCAEEPSASDSACSRSEVVIEENVKFSDSIIWKLQVRNSCGSVGAIKYIACVLRGSLVL